MIELPESNCLAQQLKETIFGKEIINVYANQSPHKFTWFSGEPEGYQTLFSGKKITGTESNGCLVGIVAEDMRLILGDGGRLRYFHSGEKRPTKHQLLLEFDDFSALVCSVQMYGPVWAVRMDEEIGNPFFQAAYDKISPLSEAFDFGYFRTLFMPGDEKLSVKAFLATKQRIPGLGNGVLQDILFHARIHPKRKMDTLTIEEYEKLYGAVKDTLLAMTVKGGRDTEKDLFGCNGGYKTILSSKTKELPCPVCGGQIKKEAYLGGSVYYCPVCQPLP